MVLRRNPCISPLERGAIEGESPVFDKDNIYSTWHYHLEESGCLGVQPKMRGKFHVKLNNWRETDSEQVP